MDSSAGGEFKPPGASRTTSPLDPKMLIRRGSCSLALNPTPHCTSLPSWVRVLPAANPQRKRFRLLYEKRIALFAILAASPGVAFGTVLIWTHNWTQDIKISLTVLEVFLWLVLTIALLDQIVRPLQTLTNVVGALREEDYSFRRAWGWP